MRVVRYTAMPEGALRIAGLLLVALALGAGLLTVRGMRDVDPRGPTTRAGGAPAFDTTPRDVTLFLPACRVRAVLVHVATPTTGQLGVELFAAGRDGNANRVAATTVAFTAGRPTAIPLERLTLPWRSPLTLRLRTPDGLVTLDERRPFALDVASHSPFGDLACAFDGGASIPAAAMLAAACAVLLGSGLLAAAWLARAAGARHEGPTRGRQFIAVAMTGGSVLVYGLVVPPFEPPDELAHLQYARFVATTGSLPREVPPPDSEWRASSYEWVQQPLYYLGAAGLLATTGLAAPGPALTPNPRARLHPGGTEPTIFQHAGPPSPDTGHRALRLLRVVSLLMALATAWVMTRLVSAVTDDPLVVGTVAGGLGLIPQWCAVMGAVSTDPPATLLATLATLAIVHVARGRTRPTWLLGTGLLIGAAYAVKATAVFLAPMAVLACVVAASPRLPSSPGSVRLASLRGRLVLAGRWSLLVGLGVLLAAGWIHARAWNVFGDPQAYAFKVAVLEAGGFRPVPGPMPWQPEFWPQMRVMVFEPFWARFGSLGAGPFPGSRVWLLYGGASLLLLAWAMVGVGDTSRRAFAALRRRRAATDPAVGVSAVAICACGVAIGLAAWAAVNLVPRADMVVHWTPRHILPLTAPAAVLVAAGLERARHWPPTARRLGDLAMTLTLVALAAAWLAVWRATVLGFHFGQ